MNSVLEIGDKILYLYQGKKWWEGSSTDLLNTDNPEINDFVYASELFKRIRKGS
jgi:phospholipid/cholesterol/gamma-HCH transport system ATP-binding protein